MTRLEELRKKLAGCTDRDGNPLRGYRERVEALRAEIAKLEAE